MTRYLDCQFADYGKHYCYSTEDPTIVVGDVVIVRVNKELKCVSVKSVNMTRTYNGPVKSISGRFVPEGLPVQEKKEPVSIETVLIGSGLFIVSLIHAIGALL